METRQPTVFGTREPRPDCRAWQCRTWTYDRLAYTHGLGAIRSRHHTERTATKTPRPRSRDLAAPGSTRQRRGRPSETQAASPLRPPRGRSLRSVSWLLVDTRVPRSTGQRPPVRSHPATTTNRTGRAPAVQPTSSGRCSRWTEQQASAAFTRHHAGVPHPPAIATCTTDCTLWRPSSTGLQRGPADRRLPRRVRRRWRHHKHELSVTPSGSTS